MTLKWKSAFVLLVVLSCQIILSGTLLLSLSRMDLEADKVSYNNRLFSTISSLKRDLQECGLTLFMFGTTQDTHSLSEFDQLNRALKDKLNRFDMNWIEQEDKVEIKKLLNGSNRLVDELMKLRTEGTKNVEAIPKRLEDIFQKGTEILAAGQELKVKNQQLLLQSNKNQDIRVLVITGTLIINLVATITLFKAFSRLIVTRVEIIGDNFSRLANQKPLHDQQCGSDEISLLDKELHNLVASVDRVRKKVSTVFANAPIGLLTTDRNGIVESMNPCAERMCGRITDITSIISTPEGQINLADLTTPCSSQLKRVAIQPMDGRTFPAEIALSTFESQGEAQGEEKQLISIMDLSENTEIDRLQEEFISIISNNIRTPLTSIQGCLSLLLDGCLGKLNREAEECVRRTLQDCEQLLEWTKTLVDITKLESGTLELSLRYLQVDTLFGIVLDSVMARTKEKGVFLEAMAADSAITADPDRTVQILEKLLNNAITSTPKGRTVRMYTELEQDSVLIKVQDEGGGIDNERLPGIFDRFSHSQLKGNSNGLGLVICRMLAESQHGSVGVSSEVAKGSTFWVRLPRARDPLRSPNNPEIWSVKSAHVMNTSR